MFWGFTRWGGDKDCAKWWLIDLAGKPDPTLETFEGLASSPLN